MGRPRAGHGWTSVPRDNGGWIDFLFAERSGWVPTGAARGWKRCCRCRKPMEESPFDSGRCVHCYFYRSELSPEEFWRLHDSGYRLAPYNIGRRLTNTRPSLPNHGEA